MYLESAHPAFLTTFFFFLYENLFEPEFQAWQSLTRKNKTNFPIHAGMNRHPSNYFMNSTFLEKFKEGGLSIKTVMKLGEY